MYKQFCKNFCSYLHINHKDLYAKEYQLSIIEPLYGLCNQETYEDWKTSSDLRFFELSNIIYKIKENKQHLSLFKSFSYELYGYGFDGFRSPDFDEEIVNEQLKLIKLLLGSLYCIK